MSLEKKRSAKKRRVCESESKDNENSNNKRARVQNVSNVKQDQETKIEQKQKETDTVRVELRTLSHVLGTGIFYNVNSDGTGGVSERDLFTSITLPPKTAYGAVIDHVVATCQEKKCPSVWETYVFSFDDGKRLGHDVLLSAPIEADVQLVVFGSFSKRPQASIWLAYQAWKTDQVWPPAVNFYDVEPINQLKIGMYQDGEVCACCEKSNGAFHADHDNTLPHLVVLSYGPKTSDRVVYQRRTLLKWLKTQLELYRQGQPLSLQDPLLRRPIRHVTQLTLELALLTAGSALSDTLAVINMQ